MRTIQSVFILILFAISNNCTSIKGDYLNISPESKIQKKDYHLIVISPKQCFSCMKKNAELIEQARQDSSKEFLILLPTNFSRVNPLYKGFNLMYYQLNRATFDFEDSFVTNTYKKKGNDLIVFRN